LFENHNGSLADGQRLSAAVSELPFAVALAFVFIKTSGIPDP
jgi:hypothetical protein